MNHYIYILIRINDSQTRFHRHFATLLARTILFLTDYWLHVLLDLQIILWLSSIWRIIANRALKSLLFSWLHIAARDRPVTVADVQRQIINWYEGKRTSSSTWKSGRSETEHFLLPIARFEPVAPPFSPSFYRHDQRFARHKQVSQVIPLPRPSQVYWKPSRWRKEMQQF